MINRFTLSAAMLTVLVMVSCCDCGSKEKAVENLKKGFAKINKFLEKNVKTEDAETNMAKAIEYFKKEEFKFFSFAGPEMLEALKLLNSFSTMPSNGGCSPEKRHKLMKKIDSGLDQESRRQNPNYQLSRLDKIIEHYAFKLMDHCNFAGDWPKMEYGYKQLAYDYIDQKLVNELPKVYDIEKNMAKAEEFLGSLTPRDGALALALEQFLSLKLTLNVETCNKVGSDILLKNDLATRGRVNNRFNEPLRRVDEIVKHFMTQHGQLCRPIIHKKLISELKELDQDTYHKVLGLASSYYVNSTQYEELVQSINQKEVNEDFTVPLMVEYAKWVLDKGLNDNLNYILLFDPDDLYEYVRTVKLIESGTGVIEPHEYEEVLFYYLLDPCTKYLETFEDLIREDKYINNNHLRGMNDNLVADLSYHMIHAGYQACKNVVTDHEYAYLAISQPSPQKNNQ